MYSQAAWNLSHPQNVELNHDAMVRAAAGIPRYRLRDGNFRTIPPAPVIQPPVPIILPAGLQLLPPLQQQQAPQPLAPPQLVQAPQPVQPSQNVQQDHQDVGQNDQEMMSDDENEPADCDDWHPDLGNDNLNIDPVPQHQNDPALESPYHPRTPPSPVTPPNMILPTSPTLPRSGPSGMSQAQYQQSQSAANRNPLPWNWTAAGNQAASYTPTVPDKWWSHTPEQWAALSEVKRRDFGHIGRIMETELGTILPEDKACDYCRDLHQECWVYTKEGARQIINHGDACARCRVTARRGGCSISKRKKTQKSPEFPGPRSNKPLLPRGPQPPPPPGGSGITV